jgi:hypothetical protein
MANPNRQAHGRQAPARQAPVPAPVAQSLPFEKTLKNGHGLLTRFQENEGLRTYLRRRMTLVVPAVALFVLTSVACAAGTVIFLADRHQLLALPGLLLAPFVLIGSLFVQACVFFAWLEGRSIVHSIGHRAGRFDLGKLPPVPWGMAAIFLFVPLAALGAVAAKPALVLIVLAILTPVLFAHFDR